MERTTYEANKYCIQDVTTYYVGCKYTCGEIIDSKDVPFKLKSLIQRYFYPSKDKDDSLESILYYMDESDFLVQTLVEVKGKIKINILEEKKSLFGRSKTQYVTKTVSVKDLVQMSLDEKKEKGLVVQELILSKLALLSL